MSLILEPLADNASEVTGQTSGYSTSSDSDLGDSTQLLDDDEQPLTREAQVPRDLVLRRIESFIAYQSLTAFPVREPKCGDKILEGNLPWISISSRGSRNTRSRFVLQKPEISAGLMGLLARPITIGGQTLPF